MKKTDINIYKYILTRQDVPDTMFLICKLLGMNGYAEYSNLVCNRIADLDLIDGNHVQIDFTNFPDLIVDHIGLIKCEDILSGYINIDTLENIEEYAYAKHEQVRAYNNYLKVLRGFSAKEIFKVLYQIKKNKLEKQDVDWIEVSKRSIAELISRSKIGAGIWKMADSFLNIYYRIKYRWVFHALRRCGEEIACSTKEKE